MPYCHKLNNFHQIDVLNYVNIVLLSSYIHRTEPLQQCQVHVAAYGCVLNDYYDYLSG